MQVSRSRKEIRTMANRMASVTFDILRETEKAVYCETWYGDGANTCVKVWIPKSCCEIQTYEATYNALGEVETYDKMVVAVAEWFLRKNRIRY